MVNRAGTVLDFCRQRAAKSDIHFLQTAADSKQRNPMVDRHADQRQRGGIARWVIWAVGFARLSAIERGMDIQPGACDHHAIDGLEVARSQVDHQRKGLD